MNKCPECHTFLVQCPCCNESFCPDCMATEAQLEEQEDGEMDGSAE
jgi:hypothetical protein